MTPVVAALLRRISDEALLQAGVIPWSCPVPAFGDPGTATVATLGLNPSNREFVDSDGCELADEDRRFHTLNSLGLRTWSEAGTRHADEISVACRRYFLGNPYDLWFGKLNYLIQGTKASYYGPEARACHLDLVPYATARKWMQLTPQERRTLMRISGDALGALLKASAVRLLILNGRSVVEHFQYVTSMSLRVTPIKGWTLPRRVGPGIVGLAYIGTATTVAGVALGRPITVLGYNHNIQSSFGVTRGVIDSIRSWLGRAAVAALA